MSRSGGRITRISSPLGSNSSMRFFSSAASAEDDGAFAFANFHSGPALMVSAI